MADLTLQERQNIQDALEATRKGAIESYRAYAAAYAVPTAGVTFAKEILECELLMQFNAAAIEKLQAKTNPKPQSKKTPNGP
jgi:hypothetical protein